MVLSELKLSFLIFAAAAFVVSIPLHGMAAEQARSRIPVGYRLVWADEFEKAGAINSTKWKYDTEANATGWYNDELQYYSSDGPRNARVDGGYLTITARKEALTKMQDYGGQKYSSARLITRGKASWTYGFFDVRAKLPCGAGTWPAIWTLGTSGNEWPKNGEIDIMEQVGNAPNTITGTVHTEATEGTFGIGGKTSVPDACTRFHNYQMTWTPDDITIGVDDKPFFKFAKDGKNAAAWPFDKAQYLILNLAIGGELGGKVDDRIFPVGFDVDYVRVYQKPN